MIDYSRFSDEEWQKYLEDMRAQDRLQHMVVLAILCALFTLISGWWGWTLAKWLGCGA